jgi:hypothetical protein
MRNNLSLRGMFAQYAILESLLELGCGGINAQRSSATVFQFIECGNRTNNKIKRSGEIEKGNGKISGEIEKGNGKIEREKASRSPPCPNVPPYRMLCWVAAIVLFLLAGLVATRLWNGKQRSEDKIPAWLVHTEEGRWVDWDPIPRVNTPLHVGQKLELASGQVEIYFAQGARVWLRGPAIFEIQGEDAGFLTIGHATAHADRAKAAGFTMHSRNLIAMDMGTEFDFLAEADGRSQVTVREGVVRVQYEKGKDTPSLLREGSSVAVEPGTPRVIVRVEPGEGTPAFHFPTIEPPSTHDFADASQGHARIRVLRGKLHPASARAEILVNGHGQSKADAPAESLFFEQDESGLILLDLGHAVDITKVNTYSWHQDRQKTFNRIRAPQKYYLYGATTDQIPPAEGNVTARGWNLIARVNTDQFFGDPIGSFRPAQQAVSITGAGGSSLGHYRYLLWDVRPTWAEHVNGNVNDNTFYGEFDVYVK